MTTDPNPLDQRLLTAQHEAAHALAYVALGLTFLELSVPDSITRPIPESRIKVWDQANVSMAGAVFEVLAYAEVHRVDVLEALDFYLDAWLEAAADEDAEADDIFSTHGMFGPALQWAWTLVWANRSLLLELGEVVTLSGGVLTYADFITALDGRAPSYDIESFEAVSAILEPHSERIKQVERALAGRKA